MRLWSIHPRYLDRQGLLALWREALLAQKVISGKTRGYKNHPQLLRFRKTRDPMRSIGYYLYVIVREAYRRGYCFDESKIFFCARKVSSVSLNRGQLKFEFKHFLAKAKKRSPAAYKKLLHINKIIPHPLFRVIKGKKEPWEKG